MVTTLTEAKKNRATFDLEMQQNFIRKIKNSIKMNFYHKNRDKMMELSFLQK